MQADLLLMLMPAGPCSVGQRHSPLLRLQRPCTCVGRVPAVPPRSFACTHVFLVHVVACCLQSALRVPHGCVSLEAVTCPSVFTYLRPCGGCLLIIAALVAQQAAAGLLLLRHRCRRTLCRRRVCVGG